MAAARRRARVRGCRVGSRLRSQRRHGQVRRRRRERASTPRWRRSVCVRRWSRSAGSRATRSPSRTTAARPAPSRPPERAGLEVVLAAYPYPPREIEAGLARPEAFGALARRARAAVPQVRQFVVGNEPNQPAFWRPQFGRGGGRLSAAGVRAVPRRGLRRAEGRRPDDHASSAWGSLRAGTTGRWRRATSRPRPSGSSPRSAPGTASSGRDAAVDGRVQLPPVPELARPTRSSAATRGRTPGFVNLDRVKQALWDAFEGTAQPTTLDGL